MSWWMWWLLGSWAFGLVWSLMSFITEWRRDG